MPVSIHRLERSRQNFKLTVLKLSDYKHLRLALSGDILATSRGDFVQEQAIYQWVFEGDRIGPDGNVRRRVTATKTGEAALISKVEDTVGGTTTLVEKTKWVRHR